MKIAIVAVILLIVVINVLAISFRRKYTVKIKSLEHEKLQIQHRPIFEEMTKVKQLNMTGETEEKFESWRNMWNTVIDVEMPKIDHLLFDAEEQIDHFKVKAIQQTVHEMEEHVAKSREVMQVILTELDELVGSEEKNRVEIQELAENYRKARKKVLAHQPAFGATVSPLEKKLEALKPLFEQYGELTEQGNYLQAREVVLRLSEEATALFDMIEEIPALLTAVQQELPASIRELQSGIRHMEEDTYYLQHLGYAKKFKHFEIELAEILQEIHNLHIEGLAERVEKIDVNIDTLYDQLEKEAYAKGFVEAQYHTVFDVLNETTDRIENMIHEVEYVKQSYRISEDEAKMPKQKLLEIEALNKKYDHISTQLEEEQIEYGMVEAELKSIQEEVRTIEERITQYTQQLKSLRNDEHIVREKVLQLDKALAVVDRQLHKGNLPGIPVDIEARVEEAAEQLYIVKESLSDTPLNMTLVNAYLVNAEKAVASIEKRVEELLENVMLIEYLIQYGNRYRRSDEEINEQLQEAEESFRQFRYTKALEEAANAVEKAEPGALKRIEKLIVENEVEKQEVDQ